MAARRFYLLSFLASASARTCAVTDAPFNAVCDNATDDATAIQAAIDDSSCDIVTIPASHACVSRALNISQMSSRALSIEGDLIIWRDPRTYSRTAHNNMFLSATDGDGSWTGNLLSDFLLSGGGRVLGGGSAWWPNAGTNRPRILWLPNCSGITVSNLTLIDSPAWNMGFRGHNITVEKVHVQSGADSCGGFGNAPNTDGCNIGGHDITVRDFTVHNGDDCIPITTGNDGTTSNVLVENVSCECGTNGVVVYNEGGTVSNVYAHNVSVRNTNQGAGVKLARPGRDATGGLVKSASEIFPRLSRTYVRCRR